MSAIEESRVTPAEMIMKMVRPSEVPNSAIVLKTAPARPRVWGVNASATIRLAMVKITLWMYPGAVVRNLVSCGDLYLWE